MRTLILVAAILSAFPVLTGCAQDDGVSPAPNGPPVDGPPVTRAEAVLTADRFARIRWTMSEQSRRGVACGDNFFSDYPAGDRIGMGYKWGGWTDIEDFLEKIAAGYGTGTGGYVDYETYPFDCVVGVSCTGLVSRAWKLNNKYTLCYEDPDIERKFCEITTEIDSIDFAAYQTGGLKKGDAFINDYHIVLFVYETRGGNPMVIDSSVEGVRFRQMSWRALASSGYIPVRYNNIGDGPPPPGTARRPIVIGEGDLPVEIEGNTRNMVSMEIDYYSAAPAIRQNAPEIIYVLKLSGPRTLTFSINNLKLEGINNDIHLLTSLDLDESRTALDCIARGDYSITEPLDAGTYFIAVDGGNDQPGEYNLTVKDGAALD